MRVTPKITDLRGSNRRPRSLYPVDLHGIPDAPRLRVSPNGLHPKKHANHCVRKGGQRTHLIRCPPTRAAARETRGFLIHPMRSSKSPRRILRQKSSLIQPLGLNPKNPAEAELILQSAKGCRDCPSAPSLAMLLLASVAVNHIQAAPSKRARATAPMLGLLGLDKAAQSNGTHCLRHWFASKLHPS